MTVKRQGKADTPSPVVDPEKIERVKSECADEELFIRIADLYRILGDSTRVRIIHALSLEELCVCDIARLLGISQSAVSHQLRILRNMRIVTYRRAGKKAYYRLDDDHIRLLFEQGRDHIMERGI